MEIYIFFYKKQRLLCYYFITAIIWFMLVAGYFCYIWVQENFALQKIIIFALAELPKHSVVMNADVVNSSWED